MVLETWVMSIVIMLLAGVQGGGLGDASILRLVRLLRLSRMARMARLLRAMPGLMIMIKGMVAAMRSVFFTIALLFIAMYVFSIAFTQLTTDTAVGESLFSSVWGSMYTLLLCGTLLDNLSGTMEEISADSPVVAGLFLLFVLVGALTIMNMLIGVLCEVVSAVAAVEREEMAVNFVRHKMGGILEVIDQDGDNYISKDEFRQILEKPEAIKALAEVEVDAMGLVDLADFIFQEEPDENSECVSTGPGLQERELSFTEFMEVVLSLRGNNQATVKDIMTLQKLFRNANVQMRLHLDRRLERIEELLTPESANNRQRNKGCTNSGSTSLKKEDDSITRNVKIVEWVQQHPIRVSISDNAKLEQEKALEAAVPCSAMSIKTVSEHPVTRATVHSGGTACSQHGLHRFESLLGKSIDEVKHILRMLKNDSGSGPYCNGRHNSSSTPALCQAELPGSPDVSLTHVQTTKIR